MVFFMKVLIENLLMQFEQKDFYQYFVGFLPCMAQLLLWKHFIVIT